MTHLALAVLLGTIGHNGDLLGLAVLEHLAADGHALYIGGTEGHGVIAYGENLLEGHGLVDIGVQLLDEENIADLCGVLFATGLKDCVHIVQPLSLISLRKAGGEPIWDTLKKARRMRHLILYHTTYGLSNILCGFSAFSSGFPGKSAARTHLLRLISLCRSLQGAGTRPQAVSTPSKPSGSARGGGSATGPAAARPRQVTSFPKIRPPPKGPAPLAPEISANCTLTAAGRFDFVETHGRSPCRRLRRRACGRPPPAGFPTKKAPFGGSFVNFLLKNVAF